MSLLETSNTVTVDRKVAIELLRQYRAAKAPATAEDQAIMTAYRQIARGQIVIQAAESIRTAGWNEDGSPKLAMTRADVRRISCLAGDNSVAFHKLNRSMANFRVDNMPQRPPRIERWSYQAIVPLIPLHLRPKHALGNYWILWEADWSAAPADPLLLRKLKGDLWLVLAAWELTAVERAVLEQRVHS